MNGAPRATVVVGGAINGGPLGAAAHGAAGPFVRMITRRKGGRLDDRPSSGMAHASLVAVISCEMPVDSSSRRTSENPASARRATMASGSGR